MVYSITGKKCETISRYSVKLTKQTLLLSYVTRQKKLKYKDRKTINESKEKVDEKYIHNSKTALEIVKQKSISTSIESSPATNEFNIYLTEIPREGICK